MGLQTYKKFYSHYEQIRMAVLVAEAPLFGLFGLTAALDNH